VTRTRGEAATAAALFDPARLVLARHLAGLRKNTLAERIGRSPSLITALEQGSRGPSPATVSALAMALQVPPAFFTAGPVPYTSTSGAPHFRSLRSTSQNVRDQAYAYGQLAVAVCAALERHVEFPPVDLPRRPVEPDAGLAEVDAAARQLRQAWEMPLGAAGHLLRRAEHHGVLVVFGEPGTATVDAYSFDNRHRPVVVLKPTKGDYYRQRFDLAHELGHLVMHSDIAAGEAGAERQAHRFAAELLMPAEAIANQLPVRADFAAYMRLKEEWGVSIQALLYRARELEIMTETTYRNAMAALSARGWRRQEPGSVQLLEQPSLLPRAVELLADVIEDTGLLTAEAGAPQHLFDLITGRAPAPLRHDRMVEQAAEAAGEGKGRERWQAT
jgi:Zn-dependent peptidase ImmA (M78 family)/transcriptional regulator with XRE-family HTH domain